MDTGNPDLTVNRLGGCRIASPMSHMRFVKDGERVLYHSSLNALEVLLETGKRAPGFELAGPRKEIYFDPSKLKCGIVTCGGICPGVNDVIRSITLSLFHHYGVCTVFGFRYGFEGLSPEYGHTPLELTPELVVDIHQKGGTILGSSRGPQEVSKMVDTLDRMNVRILFAIGGDGTLRGVHALSEEIEKRDVNIGVIGIPKTIDNDISYVDKSFGFDTAVAESRTAIYSAHVEATGARNGIGLVKLMGRHSGFIAAHAALANNDANFCLVPEAPFALEVFLDALRERIDKRHHAVVVVAEGVGQELMGNNLKRDSSGNIRLGDIGLFLRDRIRDYFRRIGTEVTLKYIDPSYTIRSMPANPTDSVFCLLLGQYAVHAGMAGRSNMVVGYWNGEFTHVPIVLAVSERKQIDPRGSLWSSVLEATGQPRDMS
jgi:6-phosphofructokinase 1